MVQTCVVRLIRAANRWVAYGDRKKVSAALKKVICTTNSIESFNNELRKATRNRVQPTNDESAL